ncbi:TetR/AcrR family transcriptional regulator [Cucumibacter marinus]|uniref:TetR/AcrR family transcriptional regulator n=1 Tax=Cucumibacter marinus TaxID=1121252 RepID=UPI00040FB4F6|nr:TetR/AcrR family transcriptional regulator [Cucumibacter marinus]
MKTSREDIVERAYPVFLAKGFEGATMATLVKASGLSKGAFYHYFPDKQSLFDACIERFFAGHVPISPAADVGLADYVGGLCEGYAAALKEVQQLCGEPAAYLRFILDVVPSRRDGLVAVIAASRQALIDILIREKGESHAGDAALRAERILALIEGAGVIAAIADDPDPMGRFRRLLAPELAV